MEPKPREQYKVSSTTGSTNNVPRGCKYCGSHKGHFVSRNGKMWIVLRGCGLALEVAHGECTKCGHPFHHTPTDVTMERLLKRAKRPMPPEIVEADERLANSNS